MTKEQGDLIINCALEESQIGVINAQLQNMINTYASQHNTTIPKQLNSTLDTSGFKYPVIYNYSVNPLTGVGTLYNVNDSTDIYHFSCTSGMCNITNY